MYFVFVAKTRHKSVSHENGSHSHTNPDFKIIFKWLPHHSLQYDEMLSKYREEIDTEASRRKHDEFWLLWGIFNECIKQTIVMAKLKKASSHSIETCGLMKN